MDEKLEKLKSLLTAMESVVVAYSGGIDSTLLLKIAYDVLGDRAVGITLVSASIPQEELIEAKEIANQVGARHTTLPGRETSDPRYLENTPDRCYFCRMITYQDIFQYAHENGVLYVLDGSNADDIDDHRPGRKAAREHGVRSPLQEVGLTKKEIRTLARKHDLTNWDKPASACLSSRVPYGTQITIETLSQVEEAESILKDLGFTQFRVRHHDQIARIEVPLDDFNAILSHRDKLLSSLKDLGYHYISLDLAGFRTGSMNEVL